MGEEHCLGQGDTMTGLDWFGGLSADRWRAFATYRYPRPCVVGVGFGWMTPNWKYPVTAGRHVALDMYRYCIYHVVITLRRANAAKAEMFPLHRGAPDAPCSAGSGHASQRTVGWRFDFPTSIQRPFGFDFAIKLSLSPLPCLSMKEGFVIVRPVQNTATPRACECPSEFGTPAPCILTAGLIRYARVVRCSLDQSFLFSWLCVPLREGFLHDTTWRRAWVRRKTSFSVAG